ncbi:MAG TPA: HNH endonuclease [Bryobacteraceae bacterium]|nr:HNH endonuclease [Bryobacteraceae bacterium]
MITRSIDPSRLVLLNIGWMLRYQGADNDPISNGGSYPKTFGHVEAGEIFNFLPWKGRMYGYAFAQKHHIDTRNLGAVEKGLPAYNATVVFTASAPGGGTRIVGCYQNATVYAELQSIRNKAHLRQRSPKHYDEPWPDYIVTCPESDAVLFRDHPRPPVDRKAIAYYRTIGYFRPGGAADRNFVRRLEEALRDHGNAARTPEESALAYEGDRRIRRHVSYERDPRVCEQKKQGFRAQHGSLSCEIRGCPAPDPGLWGDEYIECHHKIPLGKLKKRRLTRPDDLLLVCPSCHRRLHSGAPHAWISVQQLEYRLARS